MRPSMLVIILKKLCRQEGPIVTVVGNKESKPNLSVKPMAIKPTTSWISPPNNKNPSPNISPPCSYAHCT